jgi:NADH-quinone oxidoreductase subunit N
VGLSARLPDIRQRIQPEYFLFLTLSVTGLVMLVSCVDVVALVIALELSSFPLYLMVPMRREREGQRAQMESAVKYIMFGVAANGMMLFGLSYLFGLTGTTSLPVMAAKLGPIVQSPLAVVLGLALSFCGLYYKLAIFPFHFWTPDVYQGASNETAGLIATLPKIGAVAVLVRLVSLATPQQSRSRCSCRASRSAPCSLATCSPWGRRISNACSVSPEWRMPATRWSASSPSAARALRRPCIT